MGFVIRSPATFSHGPVFFLYFLLLLMNLLKSLMMPFNLISRSHQMSLDFLSSLHTLCSSGVTSPSFFLLYASLFQLFSISVLLNCGDRLFLSLEDVILKNKPNYLDCSSLQYCVF